MSWWSPLSSNRCFCFHCVQHLKHLGLRLVQHLKHCGVFQRPAAGVRKLVLATNIAETSVTIDDVVYVLNSGRAKEKSYDPYTAVSTLQQAWISRASERQRRGRAGRCRPGVCFHLYSAARAAALNDFDVPELKRTPLDELCLQVRERE